MDVCDHACIRLRGESNPSLAVVTHAGNLQGGQGLHPTVNPVNLCGHSTSRSSVGYAQSGVDEVQYHGAGAGVRTLLTADRRQCQPFNRTMWRVPTVAVRGLVATVPAWPPIVKSSADSASSQPLHSVPEPKARPHDPPYRPSSPDQLIPPPTRVPHTDPSRTHTRPPNAKGRPRKPRTPRSAA